MKNKKQKKYEVFENFEFVKKMFYKTVFIWFKNNIFFERKKYSLSIVYFIISIVFFEKNGFVEIVLNNRFLNHLKFVIYIIKLLKIVIKWNKIEVLIMKKKL